LPQGSKQPLKTLQSIPIPRNLARNFPHTARASANRGRPPNGLTFSRKPREQNVANPNSRGARLGGCNAFVGRPFRTRAIPGQLSHFFRWG
jgi:hypothetical protein